MSIKGDTSDAGKERELQAVPSISNNLRERSEDDEYRYKGDHDGDFYLQV